MTEKQTMENASAANSGTCAGDCSVECCFKIRVFRKPLIMLFAMIGRLKIWIKLVHPRRSGRVRFWPTMRNCIFSKPNMFHNTFSFILLFVWVEIIWSYPSNDMLTVSGGREKTS